jgi:hypothetical protein
MTYKATQDVVQRVRPLLERLATRTIDKARLLQYLSAMASVDWGVLRLRDRALEQGIETLTLEDSASAAEYRIQYPDCLPRDLDALVRAEYKRLALCTEYQPGLSAACLCAVDAALGRGRRGRGSWRPVRRLRRPRAGGGRR